MSMQLYITYKSSMGLWTIFNLQTNGYKLMDGFYPETAGAEQKSITDQFRIMITGSSASDLRNKISELTLVLEHARRHKDDYQACWLHYCVDDPIDVMGVIPEWMSRMLGGMLLYEKSLGLTWPQNKLVVTVIIEHKPYWDSNIEIALPLTNGNGTDVTGGLTIYNHDDGGGTSPNHHDNWVDIDGEDIEGDIPGRTRLLFTNSYISARLYTLWIGQSWTKSGGFIHIFEGESSTTGTAIADAGCSGGYYIRYALASGAEATMFTWALSSTFLANCAGGYYKVLARFLGAAPTSVKFRVKLQLFGTVIWQSGQVTLDATRALQIRDLFTFRLPPWLIGQSLLQELTMIITGQQSTGSSVNINLDFLQITPLDGYRMLECSGYGAVQNERFVDDGVDEAYYVDDGADDNKAGILVGYGKPIELYPDKDQRLYFLMHSNSANTAEILRTATVKLYYRPRRRTL